MRAMINDALRWWIGHSLVVVGWCCVLVHRFRIWSKSPNRSRKASTIAGSKCLPASSSIMDFATTGSKADLYTRTDVKAS